MTTGSAAADSALVARTHKPSARPAPCGSGDSATERRAFTISLALGLLTVPLAAQAQPPTTKTARIGYVSLRSGPSFLDEAFRQGLRELGYVEG